MTAFAGGPPVRTTGPAERSRLRVAVLLQGLGRGLQGVKYAGLIEALKALYPLLEVWDVEPGKISRLIALGRSFHPDRSVWRARYYSHPATFNQRTAAFNRMLAARRADVDAFLQVGVLYDCSVAAEKAPVVVYTDHATVLTADYGRAYRLPISDGLASRRVGQEKDALAAATHICSRSLFVADAIAGRYGIDPRKISVVGGGANIATSPAAPRDPVGGETRFLFVGKEFYRKGGDVVLKAFEKLHAVDPATRLTMVASLKNPPPTPGVCWLGNLSPGDLATQYRNADAFVMASRFETWGDVLIEAMSAGLVCLCPNRSPFNEIVTDNVTGYCFDADDIDALSNLMRSVAATPERRLAVTDAARRKVLADFTWPVVAAKLAERIDEAVASFP